MRCARWSPTIPTIIAAVSDAQLSIWDIARNILFPVSTTNFEDCGKPFSTVLFSTNGMVGISTARTAGWNFFCSNIVVVSQNIMVGGEDGLVRVIEFSQLPRIPFLQVGRETNFWFT